MVLNLGQRIMNRFGNATSKRPKAIPKPDGGINSQLFECSACARTYISESMESCSQCGQAVDRIQSERELGIV